MIPVAIALFEGLHGEPPWGEIMAAATLRPFRWRSWPSFSSDKLSLF
jgi:hypothetical protein